LEIDLHADLSLAGVRRAADAPEGRRTQRNIRSREVRVVEKVIELATQFGGNPLADLEALGKRRINVDHARVAVQAVHLGVAESIQLRRSKCRCIEPDIAARIEARMVLLRISD